jgi:hypothetical protein
MVDMAHIAGLVAAGEHPSPVPYADFVTTTTHKTLRGPRGGMILCKEEYAKAIDKAIFPGTQGGPLMHVIAAKAVSFAEALTDEFKTYQHQIILNAKAMEKAFREEGVRMVSGGTDNHLMLLDFTGSEMTGKLMEALLEDANITVNKNTVPNGTRSPFITSGIRVGTPAATSRGLKEAEMDRVARWIARILREGEAAVPAVKKEVENALKEVVVEGKAFKSDAKEGSLKYAKDRVSYYKTKIEYAVDDSDYQYWKKQYDSWKDKADQLELKINADMSDAAKGSMKWLSEKKAYWQGKLDISAYGTPEYIKAKKEIDKLTKEENKIKL